MSKTKKILKRIAGLALSMITSVTLGAMMAFAARLAGIEIAKLVV